MGDGLTQVAEKALGDAWLCVAQCDSEVYRRRPMQPIQAPVSPCHHIKDLIDIEHRRVKGDHKQWISKHSQLWHGCDTLPDCCGGLQDAAGGVEIALLAGGNHGGPACGT